jgi:SAM-dependent methyltransferase
MADTTRDAATVRAALHQQWDAAAVGWSEWERFNESGYAPISHRLVELAGVRTGSHVLDVAAGYGEPTLTAAQVVGPTGRVVATDISAEMRAHGRARAAAAGHDNVVFVETQAASLEFPPSSFDAAVSRWGIIFEPDAEGAAARVRGCLQPGARFAISSWGAPDEVPFLSLPMVTLRRRFDLPPPPADLPGPLSYPTPDTIGALLEGGGFSDVAVERGEVTFDFDSPQQFTDFIRAVAAPVRAMIDAHAGDDPESAWDAITDAATELTRGSDGPLRMSNVALLAVGTA